jgi:hypothetical protein
MRRSRVRFPVLAVTVIPYVVRNYGEEEYMTEGIKREIQETIEIEKRKRKRAVKDQAAIAVFQVLIEMNENEKHTYKNTDEYRADIKLMAEKSWLCADIFIASYDRKRKDKAHPLKTE